MKKSMFQKVLCFILSVTTLFGVVALTVSAGDLKGEDSTAATLEEMEAVVSTNSYADYISNYADANPGPSSIVLSNDRVTGGMKVSENEELVEYHGKAEFENAVYLPATGSVKWEFDVDPEQIGLYFIKITYFTCLTSESSISTIERKLKIDDKIPFSEAGSLSLSKYWSTDNCTVDGPYDTTEADSYTINYETKDDGYYKVITDSIGSH